MTVQGCFGGGLLAHLVKIDEVQKNKQYKKGHVVDTMDDTPEHSSQLHYFGAIRTEKVINVIICPSQSLMQQAIILISHKKNNSYKFKFNNFKKF